MPDPLKVRKYLLKQRFLGPDPRLADSPAKAAMGPRICISNKFPGDDDAARQGPHTL